VVVRGWADCWGGGEDWSSGDGEEDVSRAKRWEGVYQRVWAWWFSLWLGGSDGGRWWDVHPAEVWRGASLACCI